MRPFGVLQTELPDGSNPGLLTLPWVRREQIVAEVDDHLHQAAAEATAKGMELAEAERQAITRFGSPEEAAARFGRDFAGVLHGRLFTVAACFDRWRPDHPWAGTLVLFSPLLIAHGIVAALHKERNCPQGHDSRGRETRRPHQGEEEAQRKRQEPALTVGSCRRLLAVVLAVLVGSVALANPAAAHTLSGVQPTNYRSEISRTPAVDGVAIRLLDLGRRVELVNHTTSDVVVLGYDGEPYLRVGPRGVFENSRSPSVALNRAQAQGASPTVATPTTTAEPPASPSWHRLNGGRSVRWRDRRTRWEGPSPTSVSADPGHRHVVVPAWTIELRHGQTPLVLAGRITWVPGPSALPWLLLGLGLVVLTASLGLARRWGPPLSVALALLVAVDVVHSFARAASAGDPVAVMIAKVLFLGFGSTVAWVIGACSVGSLQRDGELGLIGAGAAGFLVALFSGVSDAISLGRSQLPYEVPASASRAAIVVALGMGLGLALSVLVVTRRHQEVALFRIVDSDESGAVDGHATHSRR